MTDETDEEGTLDDDPVFTVDVDSRSEYVEYGGGPNGAGGTVIAPAGWDAFAEAAGALLVRVSDRSGDVEIISEIGKDWRKVDKPDRPAAVKAIR